jgi:hypothetical protein
MFRFWKTLEVGGVLAAVLGLFVTPAVAGSYHSTAVVYGAAESYDDSFQNQVFWMEFDNPDGSTSHATALRVNQWYGLTSAHVFLDFNGMHTGHLVGNGSNYLTEPGETRTIAEYGLHPTWTGSHSGGVLDEIDLAWFRFDSVWDGPLAEFGTIDIGGVATVPEFGRPATGSGGYLPEDGERRAFDAPLDAYGHVGSFSSDYFISEFQPMVFRNEPMAGLTTPGTSGSPWFNDLGQVVGINHGGFGVPNYFGYSAAVNTSLEDAWIVESTSVPEPGTLCLLAFGSLFALRTRRRT